MALTLAIFAVVAGGLIYLALSKGLEGALPFFAFVTVLCPDDAQVVIPGLFGITPRRIATATLAVLYLLKRSEARESPVEKTPLAFLIAVHIGWCTLSTLNSVVPADSFKKMLFMCVEYYLMYYLLVKTITQTTTIHRILRATVSAVFAACVLGTFEAYTNWRAASLFPTAASARFSWVTGTDHGISSTFTDPHLFGAAVSFAIVGAFYLLTRAEGTGERLYLWIAILIMFLNVYKTVERGAWLSLILGLALLLLIGDAGTRRRGLAIVGVTLAVLAARAGIRETVLDVYNETVDTSDPNNDVKAKSYEYRYALWHVASRELDRSASRQMWGYGLESFYSLHIRAPFLDDPSYPYESCDSSWVELMIETGYVGLLIIAILLVKPLFLIFRDMRSLSGRNRLLLAVLFINLVQYYFMMTNLALYGWGQTAYMLWIWIAIAMLYKPLLQTENGGLGADEFAEMEKDRLEFAEAY